MNSKNYLIPSVFRQVSILFALFFGLTVTGCGGPVESDPTFTEMDDPDAAKAQGWENVGKGLHASFGSIDVRYPKSFVPQIAAASEQTVTGWRGERVSAQILLWTAEDAPAVQVEIGAFSGSAGKLPADIAQSRFVRYVMTDEFGPGCGYRKPEDFPSSLSADMLDEVKRFDITARTARPVWVTVDIPRDAEPGQYTAKVKVTSAGKKVDELKLSLDVIGRTLPEPAQWAYHLDLWQHPSAIARVEGLEDWSDAHFEAMRPVMKMLADAGQKVITATLNKDAWNNQSYDAYQDMIGWTKTGEGQWEYDYTVFDRWINFMMNDIGIKGMINCYSMLPWNNELHYKDQASGEMITVKADPGTPEFEAMWVPFLKSFVAHLREKGWLEITNMAMDERSPDHMDITLTLLGKEAPELGISLADNHKSYKKFTHIRDLCVGLYHPIEHSDIAARREAGLISTYYVCCSHRFPNFFTFSHPAEAVYAAWYATAWGYDGMLHWSFNNWVENPLTDSRFRTWPAGDTYMVYPGGRSSIRFERLREGVQDAEKIRILRAEASPDLQKFEEELQKFSTYKPEASWPEELASAKKMLNDISR